MGIVNLPTVMEAQMSSVHHVGQALEVLRKSKYLSREKVARDTDISSGHLYYIEKFYQNKNLLSFELLSKLISYYKPSVVQEKELLKLFYLQPSYLKFRDTQNLSVTKKEFLLYLVNNLHDFSDQQVREAFQNLISSRSSLDTSPLSFNKADSE